MEKKKKKLTKAPKKVFNSKQELLILKKTILNCGKKLGILSFLI
jgi:hypothetical protein